MKDIIINVVQNYSVNLIYYVVVMYGEEFLVVLKFFDGVIDLDQLVIVVNFVFSFFGDLVLDKVL